MKRVGKFQPKKEVSLLTETPAGTGAFLVGRCQKMSSNEIVVSLDVGTSSVKVIIGEMLGSSINIMGIGNVKSEGLKKGAIVDIDKTVHSIKRAVEQAERMVGLSIRRVIVGVAGSHIQLHDCHGIVAVASENREISDEDVARVIDAAQVVSIPPIGRLLASFRASLSSMDWTVFMTRAACSASVWKWKGL